MQYVLAKMLFATERLLKTLPCPTCSISESHTDRDTDRDRDREAPLLVRDSDSVSRPDNTPHAMLLRDLPISPAENSIQNSLRHSPHRMCSDESHTSSECNAKRLKELLLERWLLLLKLFGMKRSEGPAEGEGEGEGEGEREGEREIVGDDVALRQLDGTIMCEEEHDRINLNGISTDRQHDSSPIPISVPLPVSPSVNTSVSPIDPLPVLFSPSVSISVRDGTIVSISLPVNTSVSADFPLPVSSSVSSSVRAHAAAVGMVYTAFKERGPLTADEGAALRLFFSEIGSR
jgi:hypothetical protein